eukprot:2438996-Pleurochrysis_carterae.AAC.1
MLCALTPEFEPPPSLPVARACICLWSEHGTPFRRSMVTHERFLSAPSLSALRGNDLSFSMSVAAAGLETRSGDYSTLRKAQGARQIAGQRKAPSVGGQRNVPGEEGQRKAPAGGGDNARRQAATDGARRRVVRGERWRTAPVGEKCGSERQNALVAERMMAHGAGCASEAPGGERWRAAPGGERLHSARSLRASSCATGTAQGARRCEMARGAG